MLRIGIAVAILIGASEALFDKTKLFKETSRQTIDQSVTTKTSTKTPSKSRTEVA